MHLIRDFPAAGKVENMIIWRTDTPDTTDEVMVTCKSGSARWVLPGCYYRRGRWYHLIVEEHERPVDDQEIVTEHIDEQWERVMADVIAWAEYPEPYGGKA